MKDKIEAIKTFVQDHAVEIGLSIALTGAAALVLRNQKVTNDFLKENGLFEKFYELED